MKNFSSDRLIEPAQSMHYTLRLASAMCFIGHGAFGIITKPVWCNYFAVFGIGHDLAYRLMPLVGTMDILLGLSLLFYPIRIVPAWLVIWGLFTATLRPASGEPFAELIERAGNFGAPLALLLLSGSGGKGFRGWWSRISAHPSPDAKTFSRVIVCLRIVVFLLLLGHGWLNWIEKKSLLQQYAGLGFPNPAVTAHVIGIIEMVAAAAILVRPVRPLLLALFLWKMGTELFYPHYEVFEWVERGGSYGSLLALWFALAKPQTNHMNFLHFIKRYLLAPAVLLVALSPALRAQTDEDGIMMAKKNFCGGPSYSQSSWDHYWEGKFKRNNLNLGTVYTREVSLMGNYGITRKLNIIAGAPYVWTNATAGTLHAQHGIQDISLWLKWMPVEKQLGKGLLSLYALGGGSLPLTNYIADYLPLSIGLHSKTLSGRIMVDYQLGKFFATASGTYTLRSDITIDRNSYYTNELHLTNRVDMPNLFSFNVRTGYRSKKWIAEAVLSNMTTLGGFDIRKNDMPFPSNKMNATLAGVHARWYDVVGRLSLEAGGTYTVAGRNVGQSKTFEFGCFYILDFSHKGRKANTSTPKTK